MTFVGEDEALDRAHDFMAPDAPEERCTLECMESTFGILNARPVRAKHSQAQNQLVDDLWRLLKMVYNGATRQEALAARDPRSIGNEEVYRAYAIALKLLNPVSLEAKECSLAELKSSLPLLGASSVRAEFNQAQNQVVDQLEKVVEVATAGHSVQVAIRKVWEYRDNAAYSRLLNARAKFIGIYPSGAADAFGAALAGLSPDSSDDQCTLKDMEAAFRVLDSELVRLECSEAQENVIDDLWRLIKMMYNGSTRREALNARQPKQIHDESAAAAYQKVLRCLSPHSSEFSQCTLIDLQAAYNALSAESVRQDFTCAQNQVIDQLLKAIQGATGCDSVQACIQKAWAERNDAARKRLG